MPAKPTPKSLSLTKELAPTRKNSKTSKTRKTSKMPKTCKTELGKEQFSLQEKLRGEKRKSLL
jgi:hypothetical protein